MPGFCFWNCSVMFLMSVSLEAACFMNSALSVPEPPPSPPPQPPNNSNPVPAAPSPRNSRRLSLLRPSDPSAALMPVRSFPHNPFTRQIRHRSRNLVSSYVYPGHVTKLAVELQEPGSPPSASLRSSRLTHIPRLQQPLHPSNHRVQAQPPKPRHIRPR